MKRSNNAQAINDLLLLVPTDIAEAALLKGMEFETFSLGKRIPQYVNRISLKNGKTLTLAKLGIGPIHASLVLSTILENQKFDGVCLLGLGGALEPSLKIGDIVIANSVIQHDSKVTFEGGREAALLPGELPLELPTDLWSHPEMKPHPDLKSWLLETFKVNSPFTTIHQGTLLSGSEFVSCSKRNKELRSRFADALMIDMESAAVAKICSYLNLPFAVAKIVADKVDPIGKDAKDDYLKYLDTSSEFAGTLIHYLSNSLQGFSLVTPQNSELQQPEIS